MRWEGKNNRDALSMAASWLALGREASLLPNASLDLPQEGLTLSSFYRSGPTVQSCSLYQKDLSIKKWDCGKRGPFRGRKMK